MAYYFKNIEKKWSEKWDNAKLFETKEDNTKQKMYLLVEFPYPSGAGLHCGHARPFTAMDVVARLKRMQGYNVLFPMGYDAFGFPTEKYAIKTGIHPRIATDENTNNFTKQLKKLGYSFDWSRCFKTTDIDYVKWTQWMFIKLFNAGLAYRGVDTISWCDECKIGIANEELENGRCERCGSEVVQKEKSQWMLKMQSYSEKLIDGLKEVDFPPNVKKMQIDWIGKSVGCEIDFEVEGSTEKIKVFTTRPDTIFGVTYMVLAPEHPLIQNYLNDEIIAYQNKAKTKTKFERTELQKDKTGVLVKGLNAINPANGDKIPVFISDYVVMGYGTGAIMAVPAHDDRDYEFAKKYSLPIIPVIESDNDFEKSAYTGDGTHINSDFLNGMDKNDAINAAVKFFEDKKIGCKKVNYKMKDWAFSRQRYWGEPIPMVYCEKCGWQPIPENELPLKLPDITDYLPTEDGESPLAKCTEWVNTKCPKCNGNAKRETDTMPQWAGSCWYFLRYMDPKNSEEFVSNDKLNYWGQVDWYDGGNEHATRHLLYSRFWYKALKDSGVYLPFDEPYAKRTYHGMILAEGGVKMSKSKGNVINPDEVIEKYGADTLRTYIMFIGPFTEDVAWSEETIMGVHRFLNKIVNLFDKVDMDKNISLSDEDLAVMHKSIKNVSERIDTMKFNTAVSSLMEYANYMASKDKIPYELYKEFIKLLSPFAPYLSDELWERLGNKDFIIKENFSSFDEKYLLSENVDIVVSVNGKKRAIINLPINTSKEEMEKLALQNEVIKKYITSEIKKIIAVENKFINIVI